MGIRNYKATTPGRRGASVLDFSELTRSRPEKSLVRGLSKTGGRNNQGRITTRHIGGGHKRRYRFIDFKRSDKDSVNAYVAHIEYDPNRTARIALLHFTDGDKRYIIAPDKLSVGDIVESGPSADIKPGNNLPLKNIPTGTVVHAVELRPEGVQRLRVRLDRVCVLLQKRANTHSFACHQGKCETWMHAAEQLWALLETLIVRMFTSERQGARGGRASGLPCVGLS